MSNVLDPDQNKCCVGPDLGPKCLQILSADDKVAASMERAEDPSSSETNCVSLYPG